LAINYSYLGLFIKNVRSFTFLKFFRLKVHQNATEYQAVEVFYRIKILKFLFVSITLVMIFFVFLTW